MPAKGNKFKVDRNVSVVGKILSRKQKKRLEQIVDKKKKKEGRAELLEALTSVQISSLEGYESLSSVQTKGVKRQLVESKENIVLTQTEESNTVTTPGEEATALTRKRKRKVLQQKTKVPKQSDVVGLESESSDAEEALLGQDQTVAATSIFRSENIPVYGKVLVPIMVVGTIVLFILSTSTSILPTRISSFLYKNWTFMIFPRRSMFLRRSSTYFPRTHFISSSTSTSTFNISTRCS